MQIGARAYTQGGFVGVIFQIKRLKQMGISLFLLFPQTASDLVCVDTPRVSQRGLRIAWCFFLGEGLSKYTPFYARRLSIWAGRAKPSSSSFQQRCAVPVRRRERAVPPIAIRCSSSGRSALKSGQCAQRRREGTCIVWDGRESSVCARVCFSTGMY